MAPKSRTSAVSMAPKSRTASRASETEAPGRSGWADYIHEFDGHGIDADPKDRIGEAILKGELDSLYVQHGVEGAVDDVSGADLDPSLVRAGLEAEM